MWTASHYSYLQESDIIDDHKVSKSTGLSFNASLSITKSSSCMGKTATLALEPWSCTFDIGDKAVTCTPAVLILQKTPGKPFAKPQIAVHACNQLSHMRSSSESLISQKWHSPAVVSHSCLCLKRITWA